jgi:hypothetical protein
MTRFYFPTWDGTRWLSDEIGLEFADFDRARAMAITALGELAKEVLPRHSQPLVLRTRVADARGDTLAEFGLSFEIVMPDGR